VTPNPRLAPIRWVKSSYSSPEGGNCLEWAPSEAATGRIPVRDSKCPDDAVLTVAAQAWAAFVGLAKRSAV
jgi:hypothetical protein